MRQLKTDPFTRTMTRANAAIAMDSSASKGFSVWVNKDIRKASETGDWSELLAKAERSTKYFRNTFYR
jgi:hypothetical protein